MINIPKVTENHIKQFLTTIPTGTILKKNGEVLEVVATNSKELICINVSKKIVYVTISEIMEKKVKFMGVK